MKCIFCKSPSIITTEEKEIVCKRCGVVQGVEMVEPVSTTMHHQDQGMFFDKGLGTVSGNKQDRLRQTENRVNVYNTNKTVLRANVFIKSISEKMGLHNGITTDASRIFKQMHKVNAIPKRGVEAMVGACIFTACRRAGASVLIIDIANAMYNRKLRKKIWKGYRKIMNLDQYKVPLALSSEKFIMKLSRKMNIDQQLANHAVFLTMKIKERNLSAGLHPLGIAAACVFIVLKYNNIAVNLPELADHANVSQVTIREKIRFIDSKIENGELPPYEECIKRF